MGRCKEIEIKVIPASIANPFVRAHHYSGKVVANSTLHFGAFLDGRLHGVLSYGNSMDKRKTMALVEGTGWNEFLELNRMAFDDYLPRNSESYCIGATLRMIKKKAPHIKWIISFADGTQCGDGTIYRASNFVLTGITKNNTILEMPDGSRVAKISRNAHPLDFRKKYDAMCGISKDVMPTISDYLRGGGKSAQWLSVALHLLSRQIIPQAPHRSRASVFGNRRGWGRHVQRAEYYASRTTCNKD